MRATLGILGIALGVGASAVGVFLLALGLARKNLELIRSGRRCVFVVLAAAVLAVGAMEWALLTHDFSIQYVAENNARATPLLFTITGLWAALEGSILLWVLILAGYLAVMARRFRARLDDPMVAWALLVALSVALLLLRVHGGRGEPVQARRRHGPARRPRAEPAAAEPPADGVPPADALPRLRGLHGAVRVRDGRAHHRPVR